MCLHPHNAPYGSVRLRTAPYGVLLLRTVPLEDTIVIVPQAPPTGRPQLKRKRTEVCSGPSQGDLVIVVSDSDTDTEANPEAAAKPEERVSNADRAKLQKMFDDDSTDDEGVPPGFILTSSTAPKAPEVPEQAQDGDPKAEDQGPAAAPTAPTAPAAAAAAAAAAAEDNNGDGK